MPSDASRAHCQLRGQASPEVPQRPLACSRAAVVVKEGFQERLHDVTVLAPVVLGWRKRFEECECIVEPENDEMKVMTLTR